MLEGDEADNPRSLGEAGVEKSRLEGQYDLPAIGKTRTDRSTQHVCEVKDLQHDTEFTEPDEYANTPEFWSQLDDLFNSRGWILPPSSHVSLQKLKIYGSELVESCDSVTQRAVPVQEELNLVPTQSRQPNQYGNECRRSHCKCRTLSRTSISPVLYFKNMHKNGLSTSVSAERTSSPASARNSSIPDSHTAMSLTGESRPTSDAASVMSVVMTSTTRSSAASSHLASNMSSDNLPITLSPSVMNIDHLCPDRTSAVSSLRDSAGSGSMRSSIDGAERSRMISRERSPARSTGTRSSASIRSLQRRIKEQSHQRSSQQSDQVPSTIMEEDADGARDLFGLLGTDDAWTPLRFLVSQIRNDAGAAI